MRTFENNGLRATEDDGELASAAEVWGDATAGQLYTMSRSAGQHTQLTVLTRERACLRDGSRRN